MKENEYNDNRKNVVLLTVIAIVTMVIVLIGATFAYLASNIEGSKSANINATTNAGSDLFLITPGSDLSLTANEVNFYDGAGSLSVNSTATVLFQTTNTATEGVTKEYEVKLEVLANNFEYTSGKCYNKPSAPETIGTITRKENCTGTNLWATVDGNTYACYSNGTAYSPVNDTAYSNQLSCLSRTNYMWAPDEIAELVIDLYRDDANYTDQASCVAVGRCMNDNRKVDTSITSQAACVDAYGSEERWLPNIWEDDLCYSLATAKDITKSESDSVVQLISSVSINAKSTVNGGTTVHYYKPVVTFVNFEHNQIKNGQKNFNASLTFALINNP